MEFKCPSESEGKRESEFGGDYSENKREYFECDYFGSVGGETVSRDYMNSSWPQISDLDIGTFHQDELQLPQLSDLDVVGVGRKKNNSRTSRRSTLSMHRGSRRQRGTGVEDVEQGGAVKRAIRRGE